MRPVCPQCGYIVYYNPLVATGALIEQAGRIVLVRRAVEPRAGFWGLPAGYVEADETAEEAATREVREETQIDIEPIALAGHREAIMRDKEGRVERHFVILSFASRWLRGEPVLNSELDDARWIDPAELSAYKATEGLAEIVAAAAVLVSSET